MSALAFSAVTLTHGRRRVLSDVDVAVEPGEFIGLLGPNGSGKTTFLRAVLGLVEPAVGAVTVFDRPATRGTRLVGYMPQNRKFASGTALTGWDFVAGAAGGWRWGLPLLGKAERADVTWALDVVGAADLARRPLGSLSGGERQRLLISQALLGRPKLLLLDEPLISLDPRHQQGVVDLVKRLRRDLGVTVIFSAHELNPLLNAIDRVLYLGQGRAVLGSVEAVVTGPVLSTLYGAPIDVIRHNGRIFVMNGDVEADGDAHMHDEVGGHRHQHDHGDHHVHA